MSEERKINAVKHMSSGRSLKELATHLGLSQTTVSRVINNSGNTHRISAATQQRVLAAAAEMNYKASPLARGLRSRRSQTIGVMVPEISGGYSAAVLSGIEDVLLISGFFYFVVSHHHREELLRDYPALLLSRAVEGIIAVDSALDVELPVPIVAVSGHLRTPSILNIELDHNLAARLCAGASAAAWAPADRVHQGAELQLGHGDSVAGDCEGRGGVEDSDRSAPGGRAGGR